MSGNAGYQPPTVGIIETYKYKHEQTILDERIFLPDGHGIPVVNHFLKSLHHAETAVVVVSSNIQESW